MAEDIPSDSDLIVVGTGLVESIVAAAASRVGKQVIHLDHRDFYGGSWASFSFNNLKDVLGLEPSTEDSHTPSVATENQEVSINYQENPIKNVVEKWHISDNLLEKAEDLSINENIEKKNPCHLWSKPELLKLSRKFNFDVSPKVLYSRGEMVDILISSGVCRYAEFKNISAIYCYDHVNNSLLSVPCSRADVFNTKDISMIEKRLLMKTLSVCVDENNSQELKGFENFGDFLSHHKVQGKVRKYVMESLAMAEDSTNCSKALKSIQKFVRSIGRYGNTPFLWTLYGIGELPQCFCRCSAVFGGIYCLKRPIQSIVFDSDGKAIGLVCQQQTLRAKYLLIEDSLNPHAVVKSGFSRAILITDRSLTENGQVTLINFPSVDGKEPVRILELSAATMACPRGLHVVHLTTRQVSTASEDLKLCIDTLFSEDMNDTGSKPKILWSLHFNLTEYGSAYENKPSNLYFASGPDSSIDIDDHVHQAKHIFQSMFPDDEFLPQVPDPDDIILDYPSDQQPEETQDKSADDKHVPAGGEGNDATSQ